ncbi:MAG: quinone-dependent dihydroorotate dehydrogenase [Bdellovibrionales bacterium]|nr:quinone-dependent dihydroorotate dehydrogenase [Bdellovibrionales bacterium]
MRPWLWMPTSWSHKLSPLAINLYGRMWDYQTLTWMPFSWRGLDFTNRLGIAGGVDKNATQIGGWWSLGAGFVEIGTVTPLAQAGNMGKRVDRDIPAQALWNRLGFPSLGVDYVAEKLANIYKPHFTPIFANIGKNQATPLELAHEDYTRCINKLHGLVDAFVINISSPNTKGLRNLLDEKYLENFLKFIKEKLPQGFATPLLLKLSPDMTIQELEVVLNVSLLQGIEGWILTNTSSSSNSRKNLSFPEEGGVSGRPISEVSRGFLKSTMDILGDRRSGKLIVAVGGVLSEEDVFDRIDLGADLVQVYSSLVFNGPFFFRKVNDYAHLKVLI